MGAIVVASPCPFVMHGAREAMAAGLGHIEQQVKGIEQAVVENPGLAFDLAKTLIESACCAVLDERSVNYASTDDLPKLFKTVTQHLSFLPTTESDESGVRRSLQQTLSGLNTALQGICELRNHCGFASHGSGSPRPAMETVQALLAAEAADTIVGFLLRVHRQNWTPSSQGIADFDKNSEFNGSVDDNFGPLRVFDLEFRPSEVLFALEPETYRIYLAEFVAEPTDGASANGSTPT